MRKSQMLITNIIAVSVMTTALLSLPQHAVAKISGSSANIVGEAGESTMPAVPVQKDDPRIHVLQKFLAERNSPLADYADTFVAEADKNNIDWKLLPAISGVESTFGLAIPANSYNGWGFGIYGTNTRYFASWKDAIVTISKALREDYMNKWGATDVYAIGRIYAASPTWASRVVNFMDQIDVTAAAESDQNQTLSLSL
jgi:hypothetical protein